MFFRGMGDDPYGESVSNYQPVPDYSTGSFGDIRGASNRGRWGQDQMSVPPPVPQEQSDAQWAAVTREFENQVPGAKMMGATGRSPMQQAPAQMDARAPRGGVQSGGARGGFGGSMRRPQRPQMGGMRMSPTPAPSQGQVQPGQKQAPASRWGAFGGSY